MRPTASWRRARQNPGRGVGVPRGFRHPVFGTEPYETLIDKAAALMHSLVCNHAFGDGNKRVGLLAADVFLQLNGAYIDDADEEEIFSIVIAVATRDLDEVPAIAARLAPLVLPLHQSP